MQGRKIRKALDEIDHEQPPPPLMVDNTTASEIINDTIKQRRSRVIDMQSHWLKINVNMATF
eukprot:15346868-Ditylum_brightwellii.AAC.1